MEHWLITDITFLDAHLQLWMLLVIGIIVALVCLRLGDPVASAPPNGRHLYRGDGRLSAERASE